METFRKLNNWFRPFNLFFWQTNLAHCTNAFDFNAAIYGFAWISYFEPRMLRKMPLFSMWFHVRKYFIWFSFILVLNSIYSLLSICSYSFVSFKLKKKRKENFRMTYLLIVCLLRSLFCDRYFLWLHDYLSCFRPCYFCPVSQQFLSNFSSESTFLALCLQIHWKPCKKIKLYVPLK